MPASPLVLLHGLNGRGADMAPFAGILPEYDSFAPDLLGHGGRPVPEPLRFAAMVDDLAAALDRQRIGPAHLLGYSFGGYLAIGLALAAPRLVRSITAIATRYRWQAAAAGHVVHLTDPDRLARPGNPRREQMEAAHGAERWRDVTLANRAMFAAFARDGAPLADAAVATVAAPALVLSGDGDPLTPELEARYLARTLPNARLGLWPGSAHPLVNVPMLQVKYAFRAFAAEVEQGAFAPGPPLWLASDLVEGGRPDAVPGLRMRRSPGPGGRSGTAARPRRSDGMDEDEKLPLHDEAKARAKWRGDETLIDGGSDDAGRPASEVDDAALGAGESGGDGRPGRGRPGDFPPPD